MEELITLSCPSCGGELEVNANTSVLKCRYCGTEFLVRRDHGAVSLESYARCPKCGRNDRVEKVTAILRSQPEGSGLAKSLAPPERPSPLPKPQLIPRPETTPRPQPLPRPEATSKPTPKPKPSLKLKPEVVRPVINYRKKNNWYIVGGFGLFIISYLAIFTFLGMSFDPSLGLSVICSGISIIPLVISLVLIYVGHTGVKTKLDNLKRLKKHMERRKTDPEKLKTRFTVLSTIFFVIGSIFIIITLLAFSDDIETLLPLLGISTLPAIIGIYFLVRRRSVGKQDNIELPSIEEFESALRKWEEENQKVQSDWAQENSRLINQWETENLEIINQWEAENARSLDNWEAENSEIIKRWETENARKLDDWENENKRRLQKWKEHNSQIPQRYRDVMERWEELYFCHRDDVVFIPGEDTFAPVEKMNEYLQR